MKSERGISTTHHSYLSKEVKREILEEEAKTLADLLMKIFKFEPDNRLPASQVVNHEWFKL